MKHRLTYGVVAFAATAAVALLGASPISHAETIANAQPPTISIVQSNYPDYTPLDQTYPQVGTLLLVDPGNWTVDGQIDTRDLDFTYAWTAVAPTGSDLKCGDVTGKDQDGNPIQTLSARTARSYVPINPNIGCLIQVTVTASLDAASATPSATAVTSAPVVGVNPNLVTPQPSWTDTTTKYQDFYQGVAPGNNSAYVTFYGYPDNTPPSADIAVNTDPADAGGGVFPNHNLNSGIHAGGQAGGDGSYANPLTMATWADGELAYGTEIYIPRLQKYFIAEDQCTECQQDMQGATSNDAADMRNPDQTIFGGSDGGPAMLHFDLWIGGPGGDWPDTVLCEDALTTGDMEPIIINPGPNETYNPTQLFDPETGICGATTDNPAGVDLESANTVGQYVSYQNIPDGVDPGKLTVADSQTGMCITDPGNSVAVGTQLTMEPCDATAADQNLSFSGMSLIFNNLCLDMGDGLGGVAIDTDAWAPAAPAPATINGVNAWPVTLQRCNLNVNQQWELDDGVIGDIQYSMFSFADLGDGKLYVTNSEADNVHTYNYWSYPDDGTNNALTLNITTSAPQLSGGGTIHVAVSGLTTPSADVMLLSQLDAMGNNYTDPVYEQVATADPTGAFEMDIPVPVDLFGARYVVVVQGLSYSMIGTVVPTAADGLSTAITSVSQLVQANGLPTLDNFRNVNRTTPLMAQSQPIGIDLTPGSPASPSPNTPCGTVVCPPDESGSSGPGASVILLIVLGAILSAGVIVGAVVGLRGKKVGEQ